MKEIKDDKVNRGFSHHHEVAAHFFFFLDKEALCLALQNQKTKAQKLPEGVFVMSSLRNLYDALWCSFMASLIDRWARIKKVAHLLTVVIRSKIHKLGMQNESGGRIITVVIKLDVTGEKKKKRRNFRIGSMINTSTQVNVHYPIILHIW